MRGHRTYGASGSHADDRSPAALQQESSLPAAAATMASYVYDASASSLVSRPSRLASAVYGYDDCSHPAARMHVPSGVRATKAGGSGRTTVLGENMADRVIPFAERTGGRTVDMVSPDEWARMTPRQRWKANDGALRGRIREGDAFSYIGRDPDRPDWVRRRFDLTGSELLRLQDRGVPFEIVPRSRVRQVIGRP